MFTIPKKKQSPIMMFAVCGHLLFSPACTLNPKETVEKKTGKFIVTDTLISSLLIDTVQQSNALSQISLAGKITADEDRMIKIYPMVSGIVRDVHVQLGDAVQKGQLLASMRSMEMAGFAKEAVASIADLRNAFRNLGVTEDLYQSGMASERELEQARGEYEKAAAEDKRIKSVLQINGDDIMSGYRIKSPIAGFVVEKKITNNMQVRADNTDNLFSIADLSAVWAIVNIYESDISKIKQGDDVTITTLSYPGKVFSGKIDKIYNMLDPENKVMRAKIKINNPGYLLKPEMFANASVKSASGEELPFIKTRALVFDNDRNYILVVNNDNQVHIQPVDIAKKIEDRAYIRSGVKPGDRVIASRQVFLYQSLKD